MTPPHVGVSPSDPHTPPAFLTGRNTHPAGHPPAVPGAVVPPQAGFSAAAFASNPASPVTNPQCAATALEPDPAAATHVQPLGHKCWRVKPEQALGKVPAPPGVQVAAVSASHVQPFGQVAADKKTPQWLAVGVPSQKAAALFPHVQPFGHLARVL